MNSTSDRDPAATLRSVELRTTPAQVEVRLQRVRRRVRRDALVRRSLGTVAVVALLAGAATLLVRRPPAPLVVATKAPPPSHPRMELQDGSTIASDGSARFVVREMSDTRVRVGLERGAMTLDVTPRPQRVFVVEVEHLRIAVLGTRFTVERLGEIVRVQVERGHVAVSRDDADAPPTDLLANEEQVFDLDVALPPPVVASPVQPAPKKALPAAPPAAPAPATESWRVATQRGDYAVAYALLEEAGVDDVHDEVDDLLLAADAARLSQHLDQASTFLERVTARHATDARAPMAAFTRGKLLLAMQKPTEAARAFEQAMALAPTGALRENALAHVVEAYAKAGDAVRSQAQARAYLEAYPKGRWTSFVQAHGNVDH